MGVCLNKLIILTNLTYYRCNLSTAQEFPHVRYLLDGASKIKISIYLMINKLNKKIILINLTQ